uniref:Uncharacterized protein n=1 Tax=Trichuris muris TaxID=70415 RepID=A0A5S6QG00_TRIMR
MDPQQLYIRTTRRFDEVLSTAMIEIESMMTCRADLADQSVRCRRYGDISGAPESLAHVTQTCSFTQGLVIRRHDLIPGKIASVAEAAGYECLREPILRHSGQTLKPDLILVKGSKSFIIDVAIPFETRYSLARRYCEKRRKYMTLKQTVAELTGTEECCTGAIVIGARGAWCAKNDETLKDANIPISNHMKAMLCLMRAGSCALAGSSSFEDILDETAEVVLNALNITTATPRSAMHARASPRNARRKMQELSGCLRNCTIRTANAWLRWFLMERHLVAIQSP